MGTQVISRNHRHRIKHTLFILLSVLILLLPSAGFSDEISQGVLPQFLEPLEQPDKGKSDLSMMTGMIISYDNPLILDFIITPGKANDDQEALKDEAMVLVKYFLSTLTIPQKDLWVNLSPYENHRIISEYLKQTEMGRDMLSQDYELKQLSAALTNPNERLGKVFWDRVNAKVRARLGSVEIPLNTFNKIWIVPDKAVVLEKDNAAYIVESHMKVMLQEDYFALRNGLDEKHREFYNSQDQIKTVNMMSSHVVREVLLPEIEREVNEGPQFAVLRQIYASMILATWYKQSYRDSLLGRVYVDKNRIKGIDDNDPEVNKEIYNDYLMTFGKGVYDTIIEEYDLVTHELIPRKYFSGGIENQELTTILERIKWDETMPVVPKIDGVQVKIKLQENGTKKEREIFETAKKAVAYHGVFEGLLLTWMENDGMKAGHPSENSFTGQIYRARNYSNQYSLNRYPGSFVSDDGKRETLSPAQIDNLMSKEQRERPAEDRRKGWVLSFRALPMLKDQQFPWPISEIAKVNENLPELEYHNFINLNYLTAESKKEIIAAFHLQPEGKWYPWMDKEWEELYRQVSASQSSDNTAELMTADLELASDHSAVGGIDLDAQYLDLQIKRDSLGRPLPSSELLLENLKIDGFLPIFVGMTSVSTMK